MKRAILVAALLLAAAGYVMAGELVTNGGFESGLTPWATCKSADAVGDPTVAVVSSPVYSGNAALSVVGPTSGFGGVRQVVNTTNSYHYRLTFKYKGGPGFFGVAKSDTTEPIKDMDLSPAADWTTRTMNWFVAGGTKSTIFLGQEVTDDPIYFDDVSFVRLGAISVTVKKPGDIVLEGATLTLNETGATGVTGSDGKYLFQNLEAGTYSVTATHILYTDQTESGIVVTEGGVAKTILMTPKPSGSISGTVTASGGGNLGDARVWLTEIPAVEAYTASDGTYSLPQVPAPGTYHINCSKVAYEPQSRETSVTVGNNTVESFALVYRVLPPGNRLINGDFQSGGMAPWNEWSATHFSRHQALDPNCAAAGFTDTWVRDGQAARVDLALASGQGHGGSVGLQMTHTVSFGSCGGVRQSCYVSPGKYYRVSAVFKGNITGSHDAAVGLIQGDWNPGVYDDPDNPPANIDDVFKFYVGTEGNNINGMMGIVPEEDRWWHNRMAERNTHYNGNVPWGWMSTDDSPCPRTYLSNCIKQATGDVMTVVLFWQSSSEGCNVIFDNVVLEEVPEPTNVVNLGDLTRVDPTAPHSNYPNILPEIPLDLSDASNAKVVTGSFTDEASYFYVEEADRTAGVRVSVPFGNPIPATGDTVNFAGTFGLSSTGERVINIDEWAPYGTDDLPAPVTTAIRNVSAKMPYWDPFTPAETMGPGNIGLLARVAGTVTLVGDDSNYIWVKVDDGSGVEFWLRGAPEYPEEGDFVTATGIISLSDSAVEHRILILQIRPDSAIADFDVIPH